MSDTLQPLQWVRFLVHPNRDHLALRVFVARLPFVKVAFIVLFASVLRPAGTVFSACGLLMLFWACQWLSGGRVPTLTVDCNYLALRRTWVRSPHGCNRRAQCQWQSLRILGQGSAQRRQETRQHTR